MAPPELVVDRAQADEAAHAALLRRIDAVEPDQVGRPVEPRAVGVERQVEVRDRPPDPVLERPSPCRARRRASPRSTPGRPAAGGAGSGASRAPVLLGRVSLHRHAIHHGQPDARAELGPHPSHHLGARRQPELIRAQQERRQRVPSHLPDGARPARRRSAAGSVTSQSRGDSSAPPPRPAVANVVREGDLRRHLLPSAQGVQRVGEALVVGRRVVELGGDAEDPDGERGPREDRQLEPEAVEEHGLQGVGLVPAPGRSPAGPAARPASRSSSPARAAARRARRRGGPGRPGRVSRLRAMSAGQPPGRRAPM